MCNLNEMGTNFGVYTPYSSGEPPIENLPNEVLQNIIKFLNYPDLNELAKVSKRFDLEVADFVLHEKIKSIRQVASFLTNNLKNDNQIKQMDKIAKKTNDFFKENHEKFIVLKFDPNQKLRNLTKYSITITEYVSQISDILIKDVKLSLNDDLVTMFNQSSKAVNKKLNEKYKFSEGPKSLSEFKNFAGILFEIAIYNAEVRLFYNSKNELIFGCYFANIVNLILPIVLERGGIDLAVQIAKSKLSEDQSDKLLLELCYIFVSHKSDFETALKIILKINTIDNSICKEKDFYIREIAMHFFKLNELEKAFEIMQNITNLENRDTILGEISFFYQILILINQLILSK